MSGLTAHAIDRCGKRTTDNPTTTASPSCRPTRRCSRRRCASSKIGRFLKVRFGYILVSIYQGGAAKRQAVGRGARGVENVTMQDFSQLAKQMHAQFPTRHEL